MSQSPADLEAQIERQREQLGETVDALGARLDVKSRAREGLASAKERPEILGAVAAVVVLGVALLVWWRCSSGGAAHADPPLTLTRRSR